MSEAQATAAAIEAAGQRAVVLQADLSDEAAARALLPRAAAALGRVTAVVNSASTFEYDNAASFSYAQLDKHMRANTAPAIILSQALADHVQAQRDAGDAAAEGAEW